jgi:hypothetical protein
MHSPEGDHSARSSTFERFGTPLVHKLEEKKNEQIVQKKRGA